MRNHTYKELITIVIIALTLSSFSLWLLEFHYKIVLFIFEVILIIILFLVLNQSYDPQIKTPRIDMGIVSDILLITFSTVLLISTFGLIETTPAFSFFLAILITTVLVGVSFLNIINCFKSFSNLELIVLSYSLGYTVTSLVTYVLHFLLRFNGWIQIILAIYLVFGVISLLKHIKLKTPNHKIPSLSNRMDLFLLLLLFIGFVLALLVMFPEFSLLSSTDVARHYRRAIVYLRYPDYYRNYQYLFFHSFLSCIYGSSFPSVIIFQSFLIPLNFFLLLSFYIMARKFLTHIDNRLPIIATALFFFFTDFAWIYFSALKSGLFGETQLELLNIADQITYVGTTYPRGSGFPILGHSPFVVSWILVFCLIFLLKQSNLGNRQLILLFFLLSTSAILTNSPAVLLFSGFLGLYYLVAKETNLKVPIVGLMIGFIIAGFALLPFFYNPYVYVTFSNIFAFILPPFLLFLVLIISTQIDLTGFRLRTKKSALFLTASISMIIILSFIVLAFYMPVFNMSLVSEINNVPWYFYAELNGISIIFAIVGLYAYFKNRQKYLTLTFFILFAIFIVIMGRTISILNLQFSTGYRESTLVIFYLAIPLSVIGSVGLVKLFDVIKNINRPNTRMIISVFFVGLITLAGVSSTFLVIEHWSYNISDSTISNNEINALVYLYREIGSNPNSRVFTPTGGSQKNLAFAAPTEFIRNSKIFCTARNPDTVYGSALLSNQFIDINYLYLHTRDYHFLRNYDDSYLVSHLLPNLVSLYENSETEIYKLPSNIVKPPQKESHTTLIVPFDNMLKSREYLFSYDIVAQSGIDYSVMFDLDHNALNHETLILTFDPLSISQTMRLGDDYLNFVISGGRLIILNSNGFQFFGNRLFNSSIVTNIATRIVGNGYLEIPNIEIEKVNTTNKILAYYGNNENTLAPFSVYQSLGVGEIFYINIFPIINEIGVGKGKLIYPILKDILHVANVTYNLDSNGISSIPEIDISFNTLSCNGSITVESESIIIPCHPSFFNFIRVELDSQVLYFSKISSISLGNYTKAVIESENIRLEDGAGLYAALEIDNYVHISLNGNSTNVLLRNNDNTISLESENIELVIRSDNSINLFVRIPNIGCQGSTIFSELSINDPNLNWRLMTQWQDLAIVGDVSLSIEFADEYTLVSNFSYNGEFQRYPPIMIWNDLITLWPSLVILYLLLPIVFVIYFIARRFPERLKKLNEIIQQ